MNLRSSLIASFSKLCTSLGVPHFGPGCSGQSVWNHGQHKPHRSFAVFFKFLIFNFSFLILFSASGCQPNNVVDSVPPPLVSHTKPWASLEIPHPMPAPSRTPAQLPAAQRAPLQKVPAAATPLSAPNPAWIAADPGKWQYIIIHHSAEPNGSASTCDRAHRQRGWDELGYHFVIGNGSLTPDGLVEIGPRWWQQKHGAHCRPSPTDDNHWNEHGIGICLIGNFDKRRPSEAQLASAAQLVAWLMRQCNIPPDHVYGHGGVPCARTDCPGKYFPLGELLRRAAAINASYLTSPSAR